MGISFELKFKASKCMFIFIILSGCGKSTTIALLQRFYLLNSGSIKVDDEFIDELDLNWLRSQIAVVSQEPVLFGISIK